MFAKGIVTGLPAIKALVAEEALYVIGIVDVWVEVETGFGELKRRSLSVSR